MVIYFSATGNSKYVAYSMAKKFNEEVFSIDELIKNNCYEIVLKKDEKLGIITPTYFWGLPSIVKEYLSKLKIICNKNNYIYSIATYGTTSGQTGDMINNLLSKNNISLNAKYSVKMPDVWTPIFNLTNKKVINKKLEKSEFEINKIILNINILKNGDYQKNKIPKILVKCYYPLYEEKRKTKHLCVSDKCISCGLCAKKCPVNAIKLVNGKPLWVKEKCVMCLGCLHRCPKFAIQYENKTKNHGQYINPNIKNEIRKEMKNE